MLRRDPGLFSTLLLSLATADPGASPRVAHGPARPRGHTLPREPLLQNPPRAQADLLPPVAQIPTFRMIGGASSRVGGLAAPLPLQPPPARRRLRHPAAAAAAARPSAWSPPPRNAAADKSAAGGAATAGRADLAIDESLPATAAAAATAGGGTSPQLLRRWDRATRWLIHLATLALVADVALRASTQAAAGSSLAESAAWVVSARHCQPPAPRMPWLHACPRAAAAAAATTALSPLLDAAPGQQLHFLPHPLLRLCGRWRAGDRRLLPGRPGWHAAASDTGGSVTRGGGSCCVQLRKVHPTNLPRARSMKGKPITHKSLPPASSAMCRHCCWEQLRRRSSGQQRCWGRPQRWPTPPSWQAGLSSRQRQQVPGSCGGGASWAAWAGPWCLRSPTSPSFCQRAPLRGPAGARLQCLCWLVQVCWR